MVPTGAESPSWGVRRCRRAVPLCYDARLHARLPARAPSGTPFTQRDRSFIAARRRRELSLTHDPSCLACRIVRGEHAPPGGVLLRAGGFVLHAVADATPLRGWLVLTGERHARALDHLDAAALAALGPLAARVVAAQRAALGAEHVYAFSIGDAVRHFHLHLVPRFADTPERLLGRRCFEGRPEDMLAEAEVVRAARAVAAALVEG
jgi:diadenosine tetraphosphate (Ap4A) HIT family hydrolase